jgi:hypothetical protein
VSCEHLYVKQGDKVRWVTGFSDDDPQKREFQIIFPDLNTMGFKEAPTGLEEHEARGPKLGSYKYNVRHLASDIVLDPSVDIGDPP